MGEDASEFFQMFVDFVMTIDSGVISVSVTEFSSLPAVVVDAWRILTRVRSSVRELDGMGQEPDGMDQTG